MKPEIPMKSADEYDAFTGWRRLLSWRSGQIAKIKRRYNKRARKWAKKEMFNTSGQAK